MFVKIGNWLQQYIIWYGYGIMEYLPTAPHKHLVVALQLNRFPTAMAMALSCEFVDSDFTNKAGYWTEEKNGDGYCEQGRRRQTREQSVHVREWRGIRE